MTRRRSRAALLVAGLVLAVAAAQRLTPAASESCRAPVLVAMRGALAAVSCAGSGAPLAGAARLAFGLPLDVNRESVRALEALPGIGAGRAAAIVAARSAAPFCDVRELERVPGIGRTTLARLAGQVTAGPDPSCAVARS